jgi:hypothetical protein
MGELKKKYTSEVRARVDGQGGQKEENGIFANIDLKRSEDHQLMAWMMVGTSASERWHCLSGSD